MITATKTVIKLEFPDSATQVFARIPCDASVLSMMLGNRLIRDPSKRTIARRIT